MLTVHTNATLLLIAAVATLSANTSHASAAAVVKHKTTENEVISLPLIPHHVERARRSRALQAEAVDGEIIDEDERQYRRRQVAQQVGALYQGYGTHYVDLWCGTPPQRQTVIVDTGSSVTAFPCLGCHNCGVPDYHIDSLFVQTDSSTFSTRSCKNEGCTSSRSRCSKTDECGISMAYAEGSRWDASEVQDQCYIGGSHAVPILDDQGTDDMDPKHASHFAFDLVFGCQTSITGLFKTQLADGIMGMSNNAGTYWYQMFQAGKMGKSRQFALCFSRQPTAARKGTEAGAMTLGGVDPRLHRGDMVYTANADQGRDGFFSVKIRAIYLREGKAGESAKSNLEDPTEGLKKLSIDESTLNARGVIVDSGTTDTYWNRGIESVFKEQFKALTGMTYANKAMTLNTEDLEALPSIIFQIYGGNDDVKDPTKIVGLAGDIDPANPTDVILAFPPSHYMEYDSERDRYTPRFYVHESGGSVLGANAMMGHDVFFDIDGNRIGFAESDCKLTELLEENGLDSLFEDDGTPGSRPSNPSASSTPKSSPTFMDECDSTCRGCLVAGFLMLCFLVACTSRALTGNSKVRSPELEMSDVEFPSSYKDTVTEAASEPDDEVDENSAK